MSECDNAIECGKYEVQLQAAAQHLQDALDIGKIKAIGLMEVVTGIQQLIEERDELRSALFNARQFAVLCGHSPSWVSRWTSSDTDAPLDFVD